MTVSTEQATSELEKLWKAVFGGPPAVKSEPRTLAQFLVDHLPPAPAYRLGLDPPEPVADGVETQDRPAESSGHAERDAA